MKKFFVFLAFVSVFAMFFVSCTKDTPSSPETPANTASSTPTVTTTATITPTSTITTTSTITPVATATLTSTATPEVYIDIFLNGVNSTMEYWLDLRVNSFSYQYATVTVNSDTLVYDGGSAYVAAPGTLPYTAGINYTTTIQTEFGTYTATVAGPGGNITVINDIVNYTYDGNSDFVLVRTIDGTLTYNSPDHTTDIDSGFVIPGSAFPSSGDYNISVYPMSTYTNHFTGPTVPLTGRLMIQSFEMIQVTKP